MNSELQRLDPNHRQNDNGIRGWHITRASSFSLPTPITAGATLSAMCWTAVRDGSATMVASMTTLAAAMGLRSLFFNVPGLHHLFAGLTTSVGILAGGSFGANLGHVIGARAGRWAGGLVAAGTCLGLTLLAVYHRDDKDQPYASAGLFGTVFYSFLRDVMQGVVGRRVFPRLALDSSKSLRWEKSCDTARHGGRLGVNFVIYAFSGALLNGIAAKNVVSANFGAPGQPLRIFSEESLMAYGFRSLNEASDAFFGVMLMACFFPENTRSTPGWCSEKGDDFQQWWKEASSRVFMNLIIADIGWLLPEGAPKWLASGLTAFTEFRGAMANLKPGEERRSGSLTWKEASEPWGLGHATRAGGNCLLHAAGGIVLDGEWTCPNPESLRAKLCARVAALAGAVDDPRVRRLVEYHLQQAVSHLHALAGVEGYRRVIDGDALIAGLPDDLQRGFRACVTADDRTEVAVQLLRDPVQVSALLNSVANYYGVPGCYLPADMVPFLAQELDRPLALHVGSAVAMYDRHGVTVHHSIPRMVHIRHRVAREGEAADHFERVEPCVFPDPIEGAGPYEVADADTLHEENGGSELDEGVPRHIGPTVRWHDEDVGSDVDEGLPPHSERLARLRIERSLRTGGRTGSSP